MSVVLAASGFSAAQPEPLKSGPQPDSVLPGSFQPFNINGPFAGRQHCLVTEFRLNPVALVFVRTQPDSIDPEVKKLLEALGKLADDRHDDTGLESFVVFLAPQARSGATEDAKGNDPVGLAKGVAVETVEREKMVNFLKAETEGKAFKRLIVTCAPPDKIAQQYKLADNAEVTVVLYWKHAVVSSIGFAGGQLNQERIAGVEKGVEAMLGLMKKSTAGK